MDNKKDRRSIKFKETKLDKSGSKFIKTIINWLITIMIAVVVGYAFVTFGFQTVKVVGPSMNDTLSDGNEVLVNKIKFKTSGLNRYDVVAYKKVNSDSYYDIKRVIGLPKETVLIKDGLIYINGEQLKDCPISESIVNGGLAAQEIQLANNEYFLLGDNVNNSEDSRFTNIGVICKSEIIGKVTRIVSPKEDKGKVK